jgi:hypothetical protein
MYYIIITHSIYSDKSIKDGSKLLYGLILSLSQKDGYCYADNSYLAETLNKDSRTIQVYLAELNAKKYIHSQILQGHIRRITTQDTRVRLTPSVKTPLETKKHALKQIKANEPAWLNEYIDELAQLEG